MAKSVGTLYVDILARVDTLEKDLARARKMIDDTDKGIRKAGDGAKAAYESFSLFNSFKGRGMLGIVSDMTAVTMAFRAVKQEVMYVYENIDKIPGIPATAVASINSFKVNLHDAKLILDKVVAVGMGAFFDFGTMIGVGAAHLMGYGDGDLDAKLDTIDKIKAANDPGYMDKVRAAQLKLSEARKADAVASLHQADRIKELTKQAEEYDAKANSGYFGTLDRTEAETNAFTKRKEAAAIFIDIENKYRTTNTRYILEKRKDDMEDMTQLQRIIQLKKNIAEIEPKLKITRDRDDILKPLTAEEMERINLAMPIWIENTKSLRTEFSRIKTPAAEWRDTFLKGFSSIDGYIDTFVETGKFKLNDFLLDISQAIIKTFLKLAIINPLINAMFGGGVGGALLPALWGPGLTKGKADGGMGRGWTLVGERGPELANLGSGSFVLNATETRGRLGGGGGNLYQIDARGADVGAVVRIEQALLMLAGPGVVEQRALSAHVNARNRRQNS